MKLHIGLQCVFRMFYYTHWTVFCRNITHVQDYGSTLSRRGMKVPLVAAVGIISLNHSTVVWKRVSYIIRGIISSTFFHLIIKALVLQILIFFSKLPK